jgi:very-short-patch-repair endonuclease
MPDQPTDQPEADPEADDLFAGRIPILQALEKLRLRLLDLTRRNRLLNFKHSSGKCIQFVEAQPDSVFRGLMEGTDRKIVLLPIPEPPRAKWEIVGSQQTKPDAKDYARTLGIDPSFELPVANVPANGASTLQTLYYPEDLERYCRKLQREMKSALEETGAHMLFLVFGFIEFPENAPSDRTMIAPLISVPVIIEKGNLDGETRRYRYHLSYTDEEVAENLSLKEKLRQEHGFELPDFNENETTPEGYLRKLQQAIQDKDGWKLKRQITLTLLSFTKMLLVRDIEPSKWPSRGIGLSELTDHPIVRMVFEGVRHQDGGDTRLELDEVYNVDEQPHANIPLIYDADSSQHSALIDALSGRNMVIEGPPGTGKSQTITNLIAAAIAAGKTVLFLSEKMAALEVVKKRLTLAGLGDFCLELHSNKTHKKHVLEAIETRKNKHFRLPHALRPQLIALEEKRQTLKAYADLINSVVGNVQGLTMHSILWKAERYRQGSGNGWRAAQELIVPNAYELTDAEFQSRHNMLVYACQQYRHIGTFSADHPFWGFSPTELMPGAELEVEHLMQTSLPKFEEMQQIFEEAAAFIGGDALNLSSEKAVQLLAALGSVRPEEIRPGMSRIALSRLFTATDPNAEAAEVAIQHFDEKLKRVCNLRTDVGDRLNHPETLTSTDGEAAETLRKDLSELGLIGQTCESIEALSSELLRTAADVRHALATLEECGRIVGITFDGSEARTKTICALVEVTTLAPRNLLQYRHDGLKQPNVGTVVEKAHEVLLRIRRNREKLSDLLYLDMVPLESELTEAILVLREGDAWYRLFQSRWRQACRLHRTLAKTKTRMTGAQRLHELEGLLTLQTVAAKWNANQAYRDALGPLYQGEDTSFENAGELVSWLTTTQSKLVEAGLDETVFNALDVPESRIFEMASCSPQLAAAIAFLTKGRELLSERFPNSHVGQESFGEATNGPKLAILLNRLGTLVKDAADKLLAWSPGNISVAESLQAVESWIALPEAVKSVDEDTAVKRLLGEEFCSAKTKTQPAWDALAYGRKVLQLKLPSAITHTLLSQEVDTNFEKIAGYAKAIQRSWEIINGFATKMAEHGCFDLAAWAGAKPGDANFPSGLVMRTKQAIANMNKLLPWVQYLQQAARAREHGLGAFISLLESSVIGPDHLPNAFGYRFYGSITSHVFRDCRPLRQFAGAIHETIREEFARLDRDIIKLRGQECANTAEQKGVPPQGTNGVLLDDKTELALLTHLLPQTRPRMSIRKMMRRAGRAIQAFKPCFMMGPHAVAQFLEPGTVKFDIVVMDEASQLKPELAIGAIARGKQLIVVGDPKQLPPTSFFDRLSLTADDGEDDGQQAAALMSQSILDVCMGHFRPVRTLRWHYRSRHESLIAFSNHHFYKNLIIFPSPYPKGKLLGVRSHYIADGIYKDQVNAVEAKHLTDAVIDHMLHHQDTSLGVVTLNLKQRDLIEELLEQRFRNLQQTEEYRNRWEREGMGFFVKNLENVQGDERDVIFISTTFGKAHGTNVVRQNFGPISRPDGWRRLNVLFTRARNAIKVFTSMSPEDVVVDANTPRGTKTLRDYLEYARSGILVDITPTGGEAESDFEVAVADVLRTHGFEVEPQLGVAGYRIDIAVKHPNYLSAYLAAIECDGATYHSGVSVRDRDRIRQEILESQGWKNRIWRIWSTDWFRDPRSETAKLIAFLNGLIATPLDVAYFVQSEEIVIPTTTPSEPATQLTLERLGVTIVETEDDEFEIEVGDKVHYFLSTSPEFVTIFRISSNQNDPNAGIISERHPLAQAMLGAHIGDKVTFTDERGQQTCIVKKIIKANAI